MWTTVIERVARSVGLSVTEVSPAKIADLIEKPFGLWTPVGPRNHVLDGEPDNFEGEGAAHCKVQGRSAVSCAKTAEQIQMQFGIWTRVDPRKHVLDGVHTGATWRIPLNHPHAASTFHMRRQCGLLSN